MGGGAVHSGCRRAEREDTDMSETTEVNRTAFGQFLNQLRREKGWTQKDLAERLYVSDKAVSKWERGVSHN